MAKGDVNQADKTVFGMPVSYCSSVLGNNQSASDRGLEMMAMMGN
jgi:hypothetical protein